MNTRGAHPQRGAASVGTMIVMTPLLLVALWFAVFAGRAVTVEQTVRSAAFDGARAASLGTERSAAARASTAAAATVGANGLACKQLMVDTEVTEFRAGGAVTVTVSCHVDVSDVTSAWAPGARLIQHSATAPIDTYRGGEQ